MSVREELDRLLPWVQAFRGETFVVKVGGEVSEGPARDAIAADLAALAALGLRLVLVHGGGPQLDAEADRRGLAFERVAGRRVTSAEVLGLAVEVWRGRLNLGWVGALRRAGRPAVGLCGVDGGTVLAVRRPPTELVDDGGIRRTVDFGLVGDVRSCDPTLIRSVLDVAIPVVTPLAAGTDGEVLNVNADTVAAELAVSLGARRLLLLTGAPGILSDASDPKTVLPRLHAADLADLVARGVVKGGMRPKVAAIERALAGGVRGVHVIDGRRRGALLDELLTASGIGTLITSDEAA